MDESIQRIKAANELKQVKASELRRHEEVKLAFIQNQETTLKAFSSLINFLNTKVSRTEVVNQPRSISTPDVLKVVTTLESLHETLKTHENTDLDGLTFVLQKVFEEVEKIPKSLPELKEREERDYSDLFKDITEAIKSVETSVKAQELKVDAPVINVPETVVNVEKPDLSAIEKGHKDLVKAVKDIKIPEFKMDNLEVEKQIKTSNKLLKELVSKPVGGGGSGGGRVSPYQDSNNIPAFVTLNSDGSIPTGGFDPSADLTTDISTPGIIIETDGVRTLTTTITSTTITEVWS